MLIGCNTLASLAAVVLEIGRGPVPEVAPRTGGVVVLRLPHLAGAIVLLKDVANARTCVSLSNAVLRFVMADCMTARISEEVKGDGSLLKRASRLLLTTSMPKSPDSGAPSWYSMP